MRYLGGIWTKSLLILGLTATLALLLVAMACRGGGEAAPTGKGLSRPLKIGMLADQTGALAAYGYAHTKVAKAVVDKINREGGVNGQPIELVIEDTESDASVASVKARKLIEQDGVDFLMGSNTSAVVLAVTPIAKELKTVYFPTAGGALLTEPGKGNRYVFDFNTDVKQETLGVANYVVKKLGVKKWVTVVVNYAWGWDQEKSFTEALRAQGGEVLKQTRVPLGTADWLTYLREAIPPEAQGVYFANFGTDFLAFIRDLYTLRPDIVKFGGNYVLSGQDIENLGPAAEGLYVITGYPQRADAINTDYDRAYRQTIGMDDEGREVGTGRHLVPSYQVSTWATIYAIKEIVEETGWSGKQDTPAFIKALEKKRFKEGYEFPLGDVYFRSEDHLSIRPAYIERVENGRLTVVYRIPAEDMVYPPMVNYQESEPLP